MSPDRPPQDLLAALARMGLLPSDAPVPPARRLTGGVSSDIWRLDLPAGAVCVKRALARLRVAADWQAPIERNRYEARWMQARQRRPPRQRATPARPGRGDRRARHGIPAGSRLSAVEGPAPRRPRRPCLRRRGRGRHRRDPCRHRRRPGHGGPLPHRRHLPRHPAGALPARHRLRPSRPRGRPARDRRHHRRHTPHPGARRRQPEEHPRRPQGAGSKQEQEPVARYSWMRNAPGGATRPSTSPSASTTCC